MQLTDQTGYTITLARPAQRVISLVPSQTELLFDLDLDDEIVGVTRFCVHPAEKCSEKTIVGGTKHFNFEVIDDLQPDLIIGNKEENYKQGMQRLRERYPVWLSDVYTLADACEMIADVGTMVGRESVAARIVAQIEDGMSGTGQWPRLRAAYFIWRDPFMVVGHKTFAHEMLHHCGFVNVFGHLPRYPEVTADRIRRSKPDVLLLASEPYPFGKRHLEEMRERFPDIPSVLVDGQMFTWYGSRLTKSPSYFKALRERLRAQEIRRKLAPGSQQVSEPPPDV